MPTSNRLSRTHSPLACASHALRVLGGSVADRDEESPADLQGVFEAGVVDRQRAGQCDDVVDLVLGAGSWRPRLRP